MSVVGMLVGSIAPTSGVDVYVNVYLAATSKLNAAAPEAPAATVIVCDDGLTCWLEST